MGDYIGRLCLFKVILINFANSRLLQETKDMQQEKAEQLAPNQEHLQHVVECWLLLIRYQNLKSYMESKIQNMR